MGAKSRSSPGHAEKMTVNESRGLPRKTSIVSICAFRRPFNIGPTVAQAVQIAVAALYSQDRNTDDVPDVTAAVVENGDPIDTPAGRH